MTRCALVAAGGSLERLRHYELKANRSPTDHPGRIVESDIAWLSCVEFRMTMA